METASANFNTNTFYLFEDTAFSEMILKLMFCILMDYIIKNHLSNFTILPCLNSESKYPIFVLNFKTN